MKYFTKRRRSTAQTINRWYEKLTSVINEQGRGQTEIQRS